MYKHGMVLIWIPAKTVSVQRYDGCGSYRGRDGGSRVTDDLNRSKYGITDPPLRQSAN